MKHAQDLGGSKRPRAGILVCRWHRFFIFFATVQKDPKNAISVILCFSSAKKYNAYIFLRC